MKHVCILISNDEYMLTDTETRAVFDAFRLNGFSFDEVRVLLSPDEKTMRKCLQDYVRDFDEIFCLSTAQWLEYTRNAVKSILSQGQCQTLGVNATFLHGNKCIFLAQIDTAAEFVLQVCVPHLRAKYGETFSRTVFRAIGVSETHIKALIAQAKNIDNGKAQYRYSRRHANMILEILFHESISKRLADEITRLFAEGLKECLYAVDDSTIEQQLVSVLKLRGKKISVAESFTGGAIAKRITSVSGASEVYFEGLNTYDELSKVKRLGVSDYTLHTFGAVSDNTAYEMAAGLIAGGDCDLAIATTGLAGPNSDRSMLPVGLCYIAIGTQEQVLVYRYKFDGTREQIRETATEYALFLAYKQLRNM